MQGLNEASKVLNIIYNYRAYTAENECVTPAATAPDLAFLVSGALSAGATPVLQSLQTL